MKNFFFAFLLVISFSFASEIKWYPFEEGLKKAQEENKLILMDIYAQWCHWCNVIENTTYREKSVISIIEKNYIPVRVDAEKYPDINKKYNQGGLPTTVILTPKGEILWGSGRYISPEDMVKLLKYFSSLSKEEIKQIAERNKLRKEAFLRRFSRKIKEKEIDQKVIKKTFRYVDLKFDEEYGGFIGAPKFPIDELPYFLMLYSLFDNDVAYKMLKKTLDGYSRIIDPVEGGIYRYSTTEYWTHPHYEKLLKDQGEIAVLFFNGYSFTGNQKYREYAISLVDFSLNKLYDPEKNLFYNSQGADIVDEHGTILMSGEEFFPKGKEERETVVSVLGYGPNIEKSIYFSTNALISNALFYAYAYTDKERYKNIALKTLNTILKKGLTKEGVKYAPDIDKYYLHTQVYTLEAVLTAYQITGNVFYLETAKKLVDILLKKYYSHKTKIFTDKDDVGLNFDHISFMDDLISLNYRVSKQLYKLSLFTGKTCYKEVADKTIKRLPSKANLSVALAYYLYLNPPLALHVIGNSININIRAFKVFPFWAFSHFIPLKDKERIKKLGYKAEKGIFICNPNICFKRIDEKGNFQKEVFNILKSYREMKEGL